MGPTLGVPGVQFPLVGVDGALFFKLEAMNREVSGFFPALNGSDLAPEVGSDFLPGVQAAFRRRLVGARGPGFSHYTHSANPPNINPSSYAQVMDAVLNAGFPL